MERWLLYEQGRISALLLPPEEFSAVEATVGEFRAAAFQQVSPFAPVDRDLDGRDHHYWHLLVCDRASGALLGAQRLSFSCWQPAGWDSSQSYLEHCYPGLAQAFGAAELSYLEVGRVFVAPQARHNLQVLPALIRASGLLARSTGHRYIMGLMSYRWVEPDSLGDWLFLDRIRRPPYTMSLPLPQPRHPLRFPDRLPTPPADPCTLQPNLEALAATIRSERPGGFELPALIRIYNRFTSARVAGLSLARDFNQIVEILMCTDLNDPSQGSNHPGLDLPHRQPWLMTSSGTLQA